MNDSVRWHSSIGKHALKPLRQLSLKRFANRNLMNAIGTADNCILRAWYEVHVFKRKMHSEAVVQSGRNERIRREWIKALVATCAPYTDVCRGMGMGVDVPGALLTSRTSHESFRKNDTGVKCSSLSLLILSLKTAALNADPSSAAMLAVDKHLLDCWLVSHKTIFNDGGPTMYPRNLCLFACFHKHHHRTGGICIVVQPDCVWPTRFIHAVRG